MDSTLMIEPDQVPAPSPPAARDGPIPADGGNGSSQGLRTKDTPSPGSGPSKVLARLLRMADAYRASGKLRQALEMYFELLEQHSESAEATLAAEILLGVAEAYEGNGELHLARGIYERML